MRRTGYVILAFFAIVIGLYPLKFIGLPYQDSILAGKALWLRESPGYLISFYTHIFMGGLALLAGFTQFFPRLRAKALKLHRNLGKTYVVAVILSGTAGLAIALFASGGIISSLGFGLLAVSWLYTTGQAYIAIRDRDLIRHQKWMIRSYALCFAAVTLRIYLPVSVGLLGMDFIPAYRMIAWLCWIPNLLVAELLIIRRLGLV